MNSSDDRVLFLNNFPMSWGDGILGLGFLRKYKTENPTSVCYAMLHQKPAMAYGQNAQYEGLVDLVVPVSYEVWNNNKVVDLFIEVFGKLRFNKVIISWSSKNTIEILELPNFKEAQIIVHNDYYNDKDLGAPIREYKEISLEGFPCPPALDIKHAVDPLLAMLNNDKKTIGLFPGSSNNAQCIGRCGLKRLYDKVESEFNIILLGIETAFAGNFFKTSIIDDWRDLCRKTDMVNAIGYGSLKQVELLRHCDVEIVTSGSIVHPILYPKRAVFVNTFSNKLHTYGTMVADPHEVVYPACTLYPCGKLSTSTDDGLITCAANNHSTVSLCTSSDLDVDGILNSLRRLTSEVK